MFCAGKEGIKRNLCSSCYPKGRPTDPWNTIIWSKLTTENYMVPYFSFFFFLPSLIIFTRRLSRTLVGYDTPLKTRAASTHLPTGLGR